MSAKSIGRLVRKPSARWRTTLGVAATVSFALLAMAACSGGSAPTEGTGSEPVGSNAPEAPTTVKLTLGMAAPSAGQPCVFWADAKGVFDDLGLDLEISPQGSNEPALAAAGYLVIGANTITQSYPVIQGGIQISHVYAQTQGNPSDAITVKVDSGFDDVLDLSGQTVGVVGASGYSFAGATLYSRYIVENGGEPLNIIVQPDQGTLTAQLVNGKIAAAVFPPVFGSAIAEGILKQILSAKSDLARELNGQGMINSTFWGLRSEIQANAEAITRLVAGCRIANVQMADKTSAEIAEVLATVPNFAPAVLPTESLANEIEESWIGFEPNNQGYIDEEQWRQSLKVFASLGITNQDGEGYDPDDPTFGYDDGVDMSYWEAATPLVESYLEQHPA
jgi:ABC-type nitrate/sulfonate/bicarbonate transport system substrate-binding protein